MKLRLKSIEYENLFLALCLSFSSLQSFLNQSLRTLLGSSYRLDALAAYGLLAIILLKVFHKLTRCLNKRDVFIFFSFALFICISQLSPISNSSVAKTELIKILRQCLLLYFSVKIAYMSPQLLIYLRIAAYITILSAVGNVFFFHVGNLTLGYSQYDGYMFLNGMALLFTPLLVEKKPIDWVIVVIAEVLALLSGARGPFLISMIMNVVGLMISGEGSRKRYFYYVLTLALSVFIFLHSRELLLFIAGRFGGNTSLRNINRLLNGIFFDDNWRMRIFSFALSYISQHWLWGSGLLNDRVLIAQEFPGLGEVIGCYPHNFFLEIGMQFGAILGFIIIVVFITTLVNRFKRCLSINEKYFMIALLFSGFLPLMLSSSYLSYPMFYSLIGFCSSRFSPDGRPNFD